MSALGQPGAYLSPSHDAARHDAARFQATRGRKNVFGRVGRLQIETSQGGAFPWTAYLALQPNVHVTAGAARCVELQLTTMVFNPG